jgi:hypothetical protein
MRLFPPKLVHGIAAGAVATAATAGVLAAPASASPRTTTATATTLPEVKAKAASAISARLTALDRALAAVQANRFITATDRAAAVAILDHDQSGLTALGPVIQADSTLAKARADYRTIFTDYRVFALALPQTRLAAAADALSGTVVPRLTDAEHRLQGLLSGADSAKDTSSVQAAMADLASRIQAITTSTSGVSATVLSYTPAQWNADHTLLSGTRTAVKTARTDAQAARHDVRTVVTAIR